MKYYTDANRTKRKRSERKMFPKNWKHATTMEEQERYYAYLKHRSQARYRGEEYSLTEQDWCELWPMDLFERRGRRLESLCLMMIDPELGWRRENVKVTTRKENLKQHKPNGPRGEPAQCD